VEDDAGPSVPVEAEGDAEEKKEEEAVEHTETTQPSSSPPAAMMTEVKITSAVTLEGGGEGGGIGDIEAASIVPAPEGLALHGVEGETAVVEEAVESGEEEEEEEAGCAHTAAVEVVEPRGDRKRRRVHFAAGTAEIDGDSAARLHKHARQLSIQQVEEAAATGRGCRR